MPNDGTAEAAAVERARKGMLHEARDLKRTRIGADVLCEALLRQGVDVFFSYPGGVILPLYDVLGDYPELRHVLVRHEQGGAHAADGYARVTGRSACAWAPPGRAPRTSSPGIGTALLDSVPMVAITGNVPGALIGKDAFQEIDINGITLPMTKHNYLVRDADDLPRVVAEAFHIARTGGPGPSTSTSPRTPSSRRPGASTRPRRRSSPGCRASARTSTAIAASSSSPPAEIAAAKRPVILAGHGVLHAEAWDDLVAFAEKTQIPVAWTLLGIGAIDETPSAGLRLHGHARLEARQPGDPERRPADRHRHALRRPGDRQRPDLRPVRPDHPRRHRPGRDRQERRGRGADRRRRQAGPAGADPDGRRDDPATPADYFAQLADWKARLRGPRAGTARARGATACCPRTTSSSGSAS